MRRLKIIIFLVLLFLCNSDVLFGGNKEKITFNMSPTGYPPYMIYNENKNPSGIMYDVLKKVASKYDYAVEVAGIPRRRVNEWLDSNKLDATPRAKEWVPNPDDYVFTEPIVVARDVIFSLIKSPVDFNNIEDLFGKRIGTHLGYKYPLLDQYFKDKKMFRDDANNEIAMLKMVLFKRTDAAIINELVGLWLIKENNWQGKFSISKKDCGSVDYRIMFNKKWIPFVDKFNKELVKMKKDGTLNNIINRYK